jgi:hypothetical protein
MSARWLVDIGMLLTALVFNGCSACPRGEHIPRLAETEVLSIANNAAQKSGADLSKFHAPHASFEYVEKNCTWSVFYEGIGSTIGNHFLVIVNDNTRSAQLLGGS